MTSSRKRRKLNDEYGEEELVPDGMAAQDPDEIPDLPPPKQEITLTG